jgi:solute carrier family 13 (sodium-dependent dicarboxylate transporter), member 2/3/5
VDNAAQTAAGSYSAARRFNLIAGPCSAILLASYLISMGAPPPLCITSGILLWVAYWWLSEPVHAAITSLIPLALLPLFGILTPAQVAEAFGNELILLLMGGFMLAAALEHNGAHRRLALWMVRAFGGKSGLSLLFGFGFATAMISMWISNTASTLMMLPVALAICQSYPDPRLRTTLVLTIAYAASVGGWGTPLGTPPNLVFMQVYEQSTGQRFGFLDWMRVGVPIIIVFIPIMCLWLGRALWSSPAAELPALAASSTAERRVLWVFALVVLLWIFRTEPFGGLRGLLQLPLSDASIALAGVVLMALIPNGRPDAEADSLLPWHVAERIPWGALILFAGGIALATAFQSTGLGDRLAQALTGLSALPPWLLIASVVAGVTLLSEITSNTATAVLLMPILAATAQATNIDPAVLMFPAVLAASCGFMLPVATAPNLVAYGTGYVPLRRMVKEGALLDVLGVVVLSLACILLLR